MSEPETPLPGPSTKEQEAAAVAAAAAAASGGGSGAAAAPAPFVSYEGPKNKDGQRHGDHGACLPTCGVGWIGVGGVD